MFETRAPGVSDELLLELRFFDVLIALIDLPLFNDGKIADQCHHVLHAVLRELGITGRVDKTVVTRFLHDGTYLLYGIHE